MGLFPTHSEKELKRIRSLVNKVMALDEPYSKLSDTELVAKTQEFKDRLAAGETLVATYEYCNLHGLWKK